MDSKRYIGTDVQKGERSDCGNALIYAMKWESPRAMFEDRCDEFFAKFPVR